MYSLSSELCCEPLSPLRVLLCVGDGVLLSGSSEGMLTLWTRTGPTTWSRELLFGGAGLHGDKGLLLSLCASSQDSSCYSGGSDGVVRRWQWTQGGVLLDEKQGHSGPVCALQWHPNTGLVSGSFDQTARVWEHGLVLGGHPHGVQVLVLDNGEIITASGTRSNGTLHWWNNGNKTRSIEDAHSRKVVDIRVLN
jgi:WD40 repeat protein